MNLPCIQIRSSQFKTFLSGLYYPYYCVSLLNFECLACGYSSDFLFIALPKEKPRIDGLATAYVEGDILKAKCISDLSDPPPILSWYINGEAVSIITFLLHRNAINSEVFFSSRSYETSFFWYKSSRGNKIVFIMQDLCIYSVSLKTVFSGHSYSSNSFLLFSKFLFQLSQLKMSLE